MLLFIDGQISVNIRSHLWKFKLTFFNAEILTYIISLLRDNLSQHLYITSYTTSLHEVISDHHKFSSSSKLAPHLHF